MIKIKKNKIKRLTSIGQLQSRIFLLLLLSFSFAVFGYRVFIEIPQLKSALKLSVSQQLASLALAGNREIERINTINYDYAIWDDTYAFSKDFNADFIENNLNVEVFSNLKIDGFILIDDNNTVLFKSGFNSKTKSEIDFFLPDNKGIKNYLNLSPSAIERYDTPSYTGLIVTNFGPTLFSSVKIKKSNKTGDGNIYLIILKIFDQDLVDEMASFTFTNINYAPFNGGSTLYSGSDWLDVKPEPKISSETELYLHDVWNNPIGKLTMQHPNSVNPSWLDWKSLLFILLLMGMLYIIFSIFSLKITKPINILANKIRETSNNNHKNISCTLSKIENKNDITEIYTVYRYFNELIDRVNAQNKTLNENTLLDPLTNIANRRALLLYIEKQIPFFTRFNIDFMVIMIDVDYFKFYNDFYGHQAGDGALIKVSTHLESFFKRQTDICVRYGGEEFLIVSAINENESCNFIVSELIESFKMLNIEHSKSHVKPFITISAGACLFKNEKNYNVPLNIDSIISKADTALYQAKKYGRNQVVFVDYDENNKNYLM
ncbi:diguanylate cyclase [Shewanella frigidimarina]|uniref:diguanylate cyclase n=1 Tax=Shewanella frigidimarina TaxID=56812 RepID=UPI000F512EAD|nr:diguanylate cyclase [Shewanella frigidimarina]RPA64506.1 diguanylate cyclase [Shewanella frigidimarina]